MLETQLQELKEDMNSSIFKDVEFSKKQRSIVLSKLDRKHKKHLNLKIFFTSAFAVLIFSVLLLSTIQIKSENIIAIAAGICDGLDFGDNTKAALVSRGLAEMSRINVALGGSLNTIAGLAGVGDLMVTCNSVHSRNWRTGNLLAQGKSLDEVLESLGMVAEGVKATKTAKEFATKLNIEMPITFELFEILFNKKDPLESLNQLMCRAYKKETN